MQVEFLSEALPWKRLEEYPTVMTKIRLSSKQPRCNKKSVREEMGSLQKVPSFEQIACLSRGQDDIPICLCLVCQNLKKKEQIFIWGTCTCHSTDFNPRTLLHVSSTSSRIKWLRVRHLH